MPADLGPAIALVDFVTAELVRLDKELTAYIFQEASKVPIEDFYRLAAEGKPWRCPG